MNEEITTPKQVKTTKQDGMGRPEISEEQYWIWLEEMRPFLRQGHSLYYSMEKCALQSHKNVIYEKYRDDVNFKEKIDKLQSTITELNNSVIFKTIENLHGRLIESDKFIPSPQETTIIKLVAEKHRTSQPFFADRRETAEAKEEDFGKVVERPTIEIIPPKEDAPENKETENPVEPDTQTVEGVENPDGPSS